MKKIFVLPISIMLAFTSCCQKNATCQTANEQAILDAIQTRVSVRQFTGEEVSEEQIQTLLKCAFSAPTAVNKQPWDILVITDKEIIKQIGEKFPNSRCQNNPSVVFCLCGNMEKALEGEAREYWIQDVSAAMENLLLAAHGMGLGAVWVGIHPISERVQAHRELLGLPSNVVPLGLAVVGHPNEQPEVKNKFKEENIHYNKW